MSALICIDPRCQTSAGCQCAQRAEQSEVAALRTRVRELEAAQAWRPIETAPKDGTRILAYGGWGIAIIWWSSWLEWYDGEGAHLEPTHWQPLPSPPGDRT